VLPSAKPCCTRWHLWAGCTPPVLGLSVVARRAAGVVFSFAISNRGFILFTISSLATVTTPLLAEALSVASSLQPVGPAGHAGVTISREFLASQTPSQAGRGHQAARATTARFPAEELLQPSLFPPPDVCPVLCGLPKVTVKAATASALADTAWLKLLGFLNVPFQLLLFYFIFRKEKYLAITL